MEFDQDCKKDKPKPVFFAGVFVVTISCGKWLKRTLFLMNFFFAKTLDLGKYKNQIGFNEQERPYSLYTELRTC